MAKTRAGGAARPPGHARTGIPPRQHWRIAPPCPTRGRCRRCRGGPAERARTATACTFRHARRAVLPFITRDTGWPQRKVSAGIVGTRALTIGWTGTSSAAPGVAARASFAYCGTGCSEDRDRTTAEYVGRDDPAECGCKRYTARHPFQSTAGDDYCHSTSSHSRPTGGRSITDRGGAVAVQLGQEFPGRRVPPRVRVR